MHITVYSHYFVPEIGAPSARIRRSRAGMDPTGHGVRVITCFPNHPAGEVYPGYRPGAYLRETIDGIRRPPALDHHHPQPGRSEADGRARVVHGVGDLFADPFLARHHGRDDRELAHAFFRPPSPRGARGGVPRRSLRDGGAGSLAGIDPPISA
jgi:hypothetical protein